MDKIAKAVSEALISTKDEHKIDDEEAKKLAVLVSTVVKSGKEIRAVFYAGVQVIALRIQAILKEQELALLEKIKGGKDKKNDDILN